MFLKKRGREEGKERKRVGEEKGKGPGEPRWLCGRGRVAKGHFQNKD